MARNMLRVSTTSHTLCVLNRILWFGILQGYSETNSSNKLNLEPPSAILNLHPFVSFVAFIISLLFYLLQFCGNISLSKKSRKFVFERFDKVKRPPTVRAFALLHSELWNYGLPRTIYSSFICCDEGLAVETSAP